MFVDYSFIITMPKLDFVKISDNSNLAELKRDIPLGEGEWSVGSTLLNPRSLRKDCVPRQNTAHCSSGHFHLIIHN